jgi:YCII-related domain
VAARPVPAGGGAYPFDQRRPRAGQETKENVMAEFVFAYRVPRDYVPADAGRSQAWKSWFEGIGQGLLDIGKPVIAASAVGSCEGDMRLGGFSLIEADDMEAALEIARGCPSISAGGGVEVGALMDLA